MRDHETRRAGVDPGGLRGVVLSHGRLEHSGGSDGLARLRGRSVLPLTVHPAVWTRRRLALPAPGSSSAACHRSIRPGGGTAGSMTQGSFDDQAFVVHVRGRGLVIVTGPALEPIIGPTVAALTELATAERL